MPQLTHVLLCLGLVAIALCLCGCRTGHYLQPDPEIGAGHLRATVQWLTDIDPPRNSNHPESLDRTAEYIAQAFSSCGLTPEMQRFEVNGTEYRNVVAAVGPQTDEIVVVGAHYDVCGDQPGADDNASAVAGLLEVAGFAKRHEDELPLRVEFVAYTLEEPPFFDTEYMGSFVHAESLHSRGIRVRGMICLEMIGFFTGRKGSQRYPFRPMRLLYPGQGNFVAVVSDFRSSWLAKRVARQLKATSIPVETLKAPSSVPGVDFSDHRNYRRFGYNAVMVTDTAFYRNPHYHTGSDIIETLDFAQMRKVVEGVCWALLNIE